MITKNSMLSSTDPNLCGNFMAQKCFVPDFIDAIPVKQNYLILYYVHTFL
jgi:hypothetical protein